MTDHDLTRALDMARRSLEVLETQAAGYSALTIPAHLFLELEEKRKEIARLAAQVRAAAGTPGAGLPHNLPRRGEFVGRAAYKARVHEALRSRSYLVSIEGIGGIGKTSLALEVAYECLQPGENTARFDGAIWASARDRALTLDDVLDAVARTLDYPGIAQKPLEEKREGVVRLLRSGAYLLLVDNFETISDAAVGEFLQDLPEPSKALVTTRERKLERAWTIPLKGLEEAEALALIRAEGRRIGMPALEQAGDSVLLPLYTATGGAPLALKWAVGQIKQPGQSLETVLAALNAAQGNLFDQMFARSWEMLTPEAQRVLMVMPLFATSSSREAIEVASDIRQFTLDQALKQLVEMSLLEVLDDLDVVKRRFVLHPLTRVFAQSRLDSQPEIVNRSWLALADFYNAFVEKYGGFANWDNFDKIEVELHNILAIVDWCWSKNRVNLGIDILYGTCEWLVNYGYWNDLIILGERAIAIARQIQDDFNVARFLVWPVGSTYCNRDNIDIAYLNASEALEIFERLKNNTGIASAKRVLGRVFYKKNDWNRAEQLLQDAMEISQLEDNIYLYLVIVTNFVIMKLVKGEFDTIRDLCVTSLEKAHSVGDVASESYLLLVLGEEAFQQGNPEKAQSFYFDALRLNQYSKRSDVKAQILWKLAVAEIALGEVESARLRLEGALELYRRLDIPRYAESVEKILLDLERGTHPNA